MMRLRFGGVGGDAHSRPGRQLTPIKVSTSLPYWIQRSPSLYVILLAKRSDSMAKLPKYTVSKRDDGKWALRKDGTERAAKLFDRKADVIKGGALRAAVGKAGGSVKIQKVDGKFQEERTYPDSADPPSSPG